MNSAVTVGALLAVSVLPGDASMTGTEPAPPARHTVKLHSDQRGCISGT